MKPSSRAASWGVETSRVRWIPIALVLGPSFVLGGAIAGGLEPLFWILSALVAALVASSASARMVFVAIGGVLVFQSSDDISAFKVGFLALATLCCVAALGALLLRLRGRQPDAPFPMVIPSFVFALYVLLSSLVAAASGSSPVAIARDAAPYLLFCAVPLFAIDTASRVPPVLSSATLVAAGTLTTLGFAVEFLQRRRFGELPVELEWLAFPSLMFASALIVHCFAGATRRGRLRYASLAYGSGALALLFLTGTRSAFLLVVPILFLWLLASGSVSFVAMRITVRTAVVSVLVVLMLASAAAALKIDSGLLADRLYDSTILAISDPQSDASLAIRLQHSRAAWDAFCADPLLGGGPGLTIRTELPASLASSSFTADTPLLFIAKFGVVGALMLAWIVWSLVTGAIRAVIRGHAGTSTFALLSFVVFFAVYALLLGSPIEDKGTSLGLWLLLARQRQELGAEIPVVRGGTD